MLFFRLNLMRRLINLPEIIVGFLLSFVTVLIIIAVIFRYLLNAPISWYEELGRVIFMWIAFLGAAIGVKNKLHFGITFFVTKFPEKLRYISQLIGILVSLSVSVVLFLASYNVTAMSLKHEFHQLEVSAAWLNASVTVSTALMILYLIGHLYRVITQKGLSGDARAIH